VDGISSTLRPQQARPITARARPGNGVFLALPFLLVLLPQGPARAAFWGHLGALRRAQTCSSHWPVISRWRLRHGRAVTPRRGRHEKGGRRTGSCSCRLAPGTGRRRRAGGPESERPNIRPLGGASRCAGRRVQGEGMGSAHAPGTSRSSGRRRTGRGIRGAGAQSLLQFLMELVTGKQQQVHAPVPFPKKKVHAPVVESEMNELVVGDLM
jgi:hypothetical protein